jgi:hypothetical protein
MPTRPALLRLVRTRSELDAAADFPFGDNGVVERRPRRAGTVGRTEWSSAAVKGRWQEVCPCCFERPGARDRGRGSASCRPRSSPGGALASPAQMDATEFRRASHAVWEAMAPGWDDRHAYFEATARPVTERMLERLAPARGQTVLDLAAGTGVVGFAAAALVGSSGRAIVSDFSQAMVEAAERHVAELGLEHVECRVLDAELTRGARPA